MDGVKRQIVEKFLICLPAVSTKLISEIVECRQSEVIRIRRELIESSRRIYNLGAEIERGFKREDKYLT